MLRSLEQRLQGSGFDLFHPVHTAWYNRVIQSEGLVESGALKTLPEPPTSTSLQDDGDGEADRGDGCGRGDVVPSPPCNAVLIGNTKTVWPSFVSWLATKAEEEERRRVSSDSTGASQHHDAAVDDVTHSSPFDTYCEETLSRTIQEVCCGDDASEVTSYELFWSNGKRQKFSTNQHRPSSSDGQSLLEGKHSVATATARRRRHCYDCKEDSFLVSMQRVANVTGQYWHDEDGTKLCVHPVYGTWTAFRVLLVFQSGSADDNHGSDKNVAVPLAPPACPCPVPEQELQEAKAIFDYALGMNLSDQDSGSSYGAQSDKTWEELCTLLHSKVCQGNDWDEVPESMKPWIELRNAISVGRNDWKYDDAQLLYHYTKDPVILNNELKKYPTG